MLHFNLDKIPRSTTRSEWLGLYRWLRRTDRIVSEKVGAALPDAVHDLTCYGSAIVSVRADVKGDIEFRRVALDEFYGAVEPPKARE
jgi:hypothetical protein